MGKSDKALLHFIEEMPDEKVLSLGDGDDVSYRTRDYYFKSHGVTKDDPPLHVIDICIGSATKITSVRNSAGEAVAAAKVPTDGSLDAEEIRLLLEAGIDPKILDPSRKK